MGGLKEALSKTLTPGMRVGGRYCLVDKLGQGGFGEVWKAQDTHNGDLVAVKMPQHQFAISPKVLNSLRKECEVLKTLSHPNICQLINMENDPTYGPLLISEHIAGADLWKASRNLGLEELIEIIVGVMHGLAYLHGRKVMHLDLKPANILVGGTGPKLIDFGLASFQSPAHFAGTLPYVAPETLRHEEREISADIYSLGIVMYECLTAINPFRSATPDEMKKLQLEWMPPPPTKHRDNIPAWLSGLIMQMLDKNPKKRCTIGDILLAIQMAHHGARLPDRSHIQSFAAASGKFVGRQNILQALQSTWKDTHESRAVQVTIEGLPGMGKSRLLREIKFDAKLAGLHVMTLHSFEDATPDILESIAMAVSTPGSPLLLLIDDFDRWSAKLPQLMTLMDVIHNHPHLPTWICCVMTVTHSELKTDYQLCPFTMDEISEYLSAVAPVPPPKLLQLSTQLHTHTGGIPCKVAQLMEKMVARGYFASDIGQWDANLFDDVTVEISEVFSEESHQTSPEKLLKTCRMERMEGRAAHALERILQVSNLDMPLLVEAAECALTCGRAKDALDLIESSNNNEAEVLFWQGILLTSLRCFDEARAVLKKAGGDAVLKIRILNQLARCDMLEGHYDAAINAYLASEAKAAELPNDQYQKIMNNELGYALLMRGSYLEALVILKKYARRCETAGHVRRHLNALVQIGDCSAKMNDQHKAAETYSRVVAGAREAQQIDILSHAYNQLSKLQMEEKTLLNDAMATMKRAIAINYAIGDLSSAAVNTTNLGLCQLRSGLIKEARNNFEISKVFLERCPDAIQRSLVPCLIGLGEVSRQEKSYHNGKNYLQEATQIAVKHNIYSDYKDTIQTTLAEIEADRRS